MGEISPNLPDFPWEDTTRRDRCAVYSRHARQRRSKVGQVNVQTWLPKTDVEYLMTAWNLPTRSQLVYAALRHLMRQTQRGLPHLDGPPVGYD